MSDLAIGTHGRLVENRKIVTQQPQESFKLPKPSSSLSQQQTHSPPISHPVLSESQINNEPTKDIKTMVPRPFEPVSGRPLSHAQLGDDGLTSLLKDLSAPSFKDNALFLAGNKITDVGANKLFETLQRNTTIKHLILSQNKITPFAAAALADLLKVNHVIGWLVLSKNKLADAGISTIGQGIKYNSSLKHIIVDHNNISDRGGKELLDAVSEHPSVESIVLANNKLTSALAQRIADVMRTHPTLKKIDIRDNFLREDDKRFLQNIASQIDGFILYT